MSTASGGPAADFEQADYEGLDVQPMWRLNVDGHEVSDWTDAETGEGICNFSRDWCQGCGSILGGARYRLAVS